MLSEYIPLNILYGGCVVAVVMLSLLLFFATISYPFLILCVCVCCEEEREYEILECHKDGAIFKDSDLIKWVSFFLSLNISFFLMGVFGAYKSLKY